MKIEPHDIKVSDLVAGYEDKEELGVRGYSGKLNIRPAYQREFIYKDDRRNEVIHTVRKGYPLNIMYWAVVGDEFELMDGQQRTISICQYIKGDFSIQIDGSPKTFGNLTPDQKQAIMDYPIRIYLCKGEPSEKLDWFEIINIAGVKLSDQELRNAMYTGPWLADAKRYFSRKTPPALANDRKKLVKGEVNRQDVLETAIDWISDGKIKDYMSTHQNDKDAIELWTYWQEVFDWVKRVFPNQDSNRAKLMHGLPWGLYYNKFKDLKLNANDLEARIKKLIADKEVTNQSGIYLYLLTNDTRSLSLRAFEDEDKQRKYEEQKGICPMCPKGTKPWAIEEMQADHITPWSKGGKTAYDNCQMLCRTHNAQKSGK